MTTSNGDLLYVASQNNDKLKTFAADAYSGFENVKVGSDEVKAIIHFKDGTTRVQEFYWGSSFMSQSARILQVFGNVGSVEFFDVNGKLTRETQLN